MSKKIQSQTSESQRYYEANCRERYAFQMWCDMYDLFKDKNRYGVYITPDIGHSKYDCMVQKYDENMTCLNRYIIELKVRMVNNSKLIECKRDGWIFERSKYNSLKNLYNIDKERNEILYVNFTPDKTLVWNITTLEKKRLLKWESKNMNSHTMTSRDNKVDKRVCLLKEEWALPYLYVFDEFLFKRYMRENDIKKRRNEDTKTIGKTFTDLLNDM